MEPGKALLLATVYLFCFGTPAFLLLWGLLHPLLTRHFDPRLFNEANFSPYELATFGSFPMSLFKSLAYIRAIIWPSSMKKRFGDADLNRDLPAGVRALCWFFPVFPVLGSIAGLMLIVSGILL